jgi:hypothetical protein
MAKMVRNVLLTGAGFTANFGGSLASELWYDLYNDGQVRNSGLLIELLEKVKPDFEKAYQDVIEGAYPDEAKAAMGGAVQRAFDRIDKTLIWAGSRTDYPSLQGTTDLLREFRPRAQGQRGYFFTRNQDLLVERLLLENSELHPLGIAGRSGFFGPYLGQRPLTKEECRTLPEEAQLPRIRANAEAYCRFAYVKLHGSQSWHDSQGKGILVIGGGKEDRISREPLLRWYFELFSAVLSDCPHRLVVIGYGFRDAHVNNVMADAIRHPGLDLVIISPEPKEAFDAHLEDQPRGSEIGSALLQPGSRYYKRFLKDLFPQSTIDTPTEHWRELCSFLRS